MAVPDFQALMLPVLQVVAESDSIAAPDLRAKVASRLALSEAELDERLPSGRHTVFGNRVAWANVYLQRAGLIKVVRRGVYAITEAGRGVLERNVSSLKTDDLEEFPGYNEWRKRAARPEDDEGGGQIRPPSTSVTDPEEQIERSHRELTTAVEAELLDRLRTVAPSQFEQIIIDLLVAMGYGGGRAEMAKAVGRSGDNGVDGVIREDRLGLDVVYMQAKRYAAGNPVGASDVRDFVGALDMHRASKGIFVTTSTFPKSAYELVTRASKRVVLVDGEELARLMVAHGVGVRVKTRYDISELDDDYFTS